MSGSSKTEVPFISKNYLIELTRGKKLITRLDKGSFPRGWTGLIEHFIKVVGNYSIVITSVDDSHGFLDIEVDLTLTPRKDTVYNEILRAKHQSMNICINCGGYRDSRKKLCDDCNKNAGALKLTGTWLDDY